VNTLDYLPRQTRQQALADQLDRIRRATARFAALSPPGNAQGCPCIAIYGSCRCTER
jgi:hypothetical protein